MGKPWDHPLLGRPSCAPFNEFRTHRSEGSLSSGAFDSLIHPPSSGGDALRLCSSLNFSAFRAEPSQSGKNSTAKHLCLVRDKGYFPLIDYTTLLVSCDG